jgi:hypothetical protein
MDVFLALIHHEDDTDVYVGTTQASVDEAVLEYVRDNWDEERHGNMPDEEDMVEVYFEAEQNELFGGEWLEHRQQPLIGYAKKKKAKKKKAKKRT